MAGDSTKSAEILADDDRLANWMTVKYDAGDFKKSVEVLDVNVTDESPSPYEEPST
jgi:hypothetical protein